MIATAATTTTTTNNNTTTNVMQHQNANRKGILDKTGESSINLVKTSRTEYVS